MQEPFELDEIIVEFLVESHENLDRLDRDLVALEKIPGSRELLASIFRTVHTIKGTSGFLAFHHLESLTHAGESLLARVRDGELALNRERTSVLLELVDAIRGLLATIEATGMEGDPSFAMLVERVNSLMLDEIPAGDGSVRQDPADAQVQAERRRSIADSTLRVEVDLLDSLVRLVGELLLTGTEVVSYAGTHSDPNLARTSRRLNEIASELQEGVMKTRMQPIDTVWSKLPRVVRDLGVACGRDVRLVMEGQDTELDKTILEAIRDPLTHLMRNLIDHGIEPPEIRVACGKPAEGTLTLRAFHEGGHVTIEVADDGAGIDPEAIAAKALDRGLVSNADLIRMSTREVLSLIFIPGFSIREQVSHVSGRGVGMDVVKTNIEKIGGTVDVLSALGVGTTFKIRIPLTVAILAAVTPESSAERHAMPQVTLEELVSLDRGQGIKEISGASVYRLRERLLPLVFFRHVLGLAPAPVGTPQYIAVLRADSQKFGFVVDQVLNNEEIVIKPPGAQLKRISIYAGATILGDGRTSHILDTLARAKTAGAPGADRISTAELVKAALLAGATLPILDSADLASIVSAVLLSLELDFVTASAPVDLEVTTTSSVTISGAWEGAVLFELCPGLDRLLAAAMFQAEKLGEDDVGDAIGELANIIGGNVKGLLLEPSRLSLPTVVSGRHLNLRMPGSVLVGELFGWCQSLPLRVSVWALLPGQPT